MSLFDYQPGELSRLLNPSAQPDLYQLTKPPQPAPSTRTKRTIDSSDQHDAHAAKKKKLDRPQASQRDGQHSVSKRERLALQAAGGTRGVSAGVDGEDVAADGADDDEDVEGGDDDEAADDDEGELSDLSDLDDSELYADMDASTARQLRKHKRLLEDEQVEQQHNTANKPNKAQPTASPHSDPRLPRTLFAGNVPTAATRQQLTRFFRQFGAVDSVRLRSFSTSNPKLTKRVAMIRGAIHPERQSMNAYVVFEAPEGVEKAVASNGIDYEGHKLRLDYADRSSSKATAGTAGTAAGLAVFVGNLPFSVSEQQLYDVFDGCGAITGVRVVRDPLLALGKGFAFVTFDSAVAVKKALAMQGAAIDGRELRLSKAMDETKAREVRDKRLRDAQPAAAGAARRLQNKAKHGQRKAAAAGPGRAERKVYVGEVSNPLEYVQKARRLEKKQQMKKEERRKKRSLVKVKKPRLKTAAEGDSSASSKKASTKRKDQS